MVSKVEEFLFCPISDFVLEATGERPELLEENFIPPAGDYIAVKLEMIVPIAWGSSAEDVESVEASYNTTYELTTRIVGYGDTAMQRVMACNVRLNDKSLLRRTLKPKGLAYFDRTPVRDTSISWQDKREKRYEFLAKFRFVAGATFLFDEGSIETVGATTPTYN